MTEDKARVMVELYNRGWSDLSAFSKACRGIQCLKLLKREHIEGVWWALEVGGKRAPVNGPLHPTESGIIIDVSPLGGRTT